MSPAATPSGTKLADTFEAAPAAPAPTEIIHVMARTVACDGGGGVLGHPRVFLRIPGTETMCPYCSRLYVLQPGADHGQDH